MLAASCSKKWTPPVLAEMLASLAARIRTLAAGDPAPVLGCLREKGLQP